ncbi:MAG: hypothetical protein LUD46_18030 [Parabacteroides sp.]|nr:hypothetical protein [Parabacteroides sp.]
MKITAPRINKVLKEDVAFCDLPLKEGDDLIEYSVKNQRKLELKTKNISAQSCLFSDCLLIGCSIKNRSSAI